MQRCHDSGLNVASRFPRESGTSVRFQSRQLKTGWNWKLSPRGFKLSRNRFNFTRLRRKRRTMEKLLLFLLFLSAFATLHELRAVASSTDGNVLQFESGYLVETVVEEGNKLGVEPYSIRVSPEGELFAVDAVNSNIVRISPPLSQCMPSSLQDSEYLGSVPSLMSIPDSRARLVAGSFQGYSGHVDGKPSDARFNHPKGVTMDDKGNVYVADTLNFAIRKIGEAGVTTIAGGKANMPGYRDGPSEDAKFSSDFDVVYIGRTCSLLVVDRGNAALRQISLQPEDCDLENSSISPSGLDNTAGRD
ncbi:hypothetical protein ACLOJK_008695 [Asimina triloba]